jgi:elongation factor P--(R)-beta-lysine ligase
MNELTLPILKYRSGFIKAIRSFFASKDFSEVDTPILKSFAGIEPYLDPMVVSSPHKSKEGYLITSPEYSMKQILSLGFENIYEISHSFRSGEKGEMHSAEFLMLEFYQSGADENTLMETCIELLEYLCVNFFDFGFQKAECKIVTMEFLFYQFTARGFSRSEILCTLKEKFPSSSYDEMAYEDLFFLVFLNLIEPNLESEFVFIKDYPAELSSLARIENGISRRFEIYFGRIEIGNAFYELNSESEQRQRFISEQAKRKTLNKEVFELDEKFLKSLNSLPICSGIAIGLDRLFMVIMNEKSLKSISPYYGDSP